MRTRRGTSPRCSPRSPAPPRDTKFCLKFERLGVPEVWIDVWPNGFYNATELLPLRRIPFDSGHVWAPYLGRMYGDWRVPVVYSRH